MPSTYEMKFGFPFAIGLCAIAGSSFGQEHSSKESQGKVFCPVCVANGYASSTTAAGKDWFITGNSVGGALWYQGIDRLQIGVGFHSSSEAVRGLFSYRLIPNLGRDLGLNIGYGFQNQESGATGVSSTLEWNPQLERGSLNVYAGASRQTDARNRFIYGAKWSPDGVWFVGNQFDGRDHNPFFQRSFGHYSVGLIYVAGKRVSLSAGYQF